MNFHAMYRASLYAMLFLASLVLTYDASADNRFALLHPLVAAFAGIGAFLTVDRNPDHGLTRGLANTLGFASAVLAYLEYQAGVNPALAMGYCLVYLALIKMFLPKSIRDDWYLFLIGLVQVVIGTFLGHGETLGLLMLAWALATLWALGLFHLDREARRNGPGPGAVLIPAPDRRVPYPGLVDPPFLLASARVAATTLALGGLIFLAMPRWGAQASMKKGAPVPSHLTGFSSQVKLGQIGEILENDAVVMTVQLSDRSGRLRPEDDPLWRGVALPVYRNGYWSRPSVRPLTFPGFAFPRDRAIRQFIRLEPTDSPVLFALRPFARASSPSGEGIGFDQFDGTLARGEFDSHAYYEYEVFSLTDDRRQPGEQLGPPFGRPADRAALLREVLRYAPELLAVPDAPRGLEDRLRALAERVVGALPADDVEGRCRALEAYLSRSGDFTYSLRMGRADPNLDPVEDFLFRRKQGHCEYFASALALLLRSIDIPSRIINGFKGGDWNELAGALSVRQKHAHSWVEALVSDGEEGPDWLTLDPSPSAQREETVARVGGLASRFRLISDYLRYIWIFYIVGYNSDRQDRLLYNPIRFLASEAARGFAMMADLLRTAFGWLFLFREAKDLFSARGFFGSTFLLLLTAGIVALARRLIRRLRAVRDGAGDALMSASVAFYRRLSDLLAACGLTRSPTETPREFARRASAFLAGREDCLADVPAAVVDAYYGVRYGQLALPPEVLGRLEARLDALEAGLGHEGRA